jgi:hypothetical protein
MIAACALNNQTAGVKKSAVPGISQLTGGDDLSGGGEKPVLIGKDQCGREIE